MEEVNTVVGPSNAQMGGGNLFSIVLLAEGIVHDLVQFLWLPS